MATDTAPPSPAGTPPSVRSEPPAIPERTTPSTSGSGRRARRTATPPDGGRTTATLIKDAVAGLQALVRKEVELAKLELKELVDARVRALAATAVAGVMALFAVGFLGAALAKGLEEALAPWLAWLIVGLIFLVVAGVALLMAKNKGKRGGPPLARTKASIRQSRQRVTRFRRR